MAVLAAACGPAPPSDDDGSSPEEWTTFQGNPRHTGYQPVSLAPSDFTELFDILVQGGLELNPPVVTGDTVFVSERGWFEPQTLFAISAATGETIWRADFGAIHSLGPPACGDGKVFMATSGHDDSFLYGFNAATGTQAFATSFPNQWSLYYAPVVWNGAVYMGGGYYGGMLAYDASDGHELWALELNQYDEWTPALGDSRAIAYTGEYYPKVSVIDTATGQVVFEIDDPEFVWDGWSMNEAPALSLRDRVFVTNGGRLIAFGLILRRMTWRWPGSFKGQVTLGDDVIYVVNGGEVDVREAGGGSLLWTWSPPAESPALSPKKALLATKTHLFVSCESEEIGGVETVGKTYALNLATHEVDWTYSRGGHLALSKQGILLIATRSGRLAAVRLIPPA
jgi:outer membrane protein assembly factor BamB